VAFYVGFIAFDAKYLSEPEPLMFNFQYQPANSRYSDGAKPAEGTWAFAKIEVVLNHLRLWLRESIAADSPGAPLVVKKRVIAAGRLRGKIKLEVTRINFIQKAAGLTIDQRTELKARSSVT